MIASLLVKNSDERQPVTEADSSDQGAAGVTDGVGPCYHSEGNRADGRAFSTSPAVADAAPDLTALVVEFVCADVLHESTGGLLVPAYQERRARAYKALISAITGLDEPRRTMSGDIVERLRDPWWSMNGKLVQRTMREAADEIERLRRGIGIESHEIEQRIAALYPDEFPKYPDDWNAGDDRCAGDHTSVTLVMKACDEIERLRQQIVDHEREER